MRLFIAVTPPPAICRQLEKLAKELKRKHWPVTWEPVGKLHFTLAFLGEIDEARLPEVRRVVEASCLQVNSFILKIKGLGCFPDYFQPRIIWLGLKGDLKSLAQLQKLIQQGLEEVGVKIDKKPFRPHVTLGRVKRARFREKKEIGRQLKALRIKEISVDWKVNGVEIYSSQTLPTGSVYKALAHIPLKKL